MVKKLSTNSFPKKSIFLPVSEQNRITSPGNLLREDKQLSEQGYSLSYLKRINFDKVYSPFWGLSIFKNKRYKMFDNFYFLQDDKMISFAISDLGLGINFRLFYYNFTEKRMLEDFSETITWRNNASPKLEIDPFSGLDFNYQWSRKNNFIEIAQKKGSEGWLYECKFQTPKIGGNIQMQRNSSKQDYYEIFPTTSNPKMFFYQMKSYQNPSQINADFNGQRIFDPAV